MGIWWKYVCMFLINKPTINFLELFIVSQSTKLKKKGDLGILTRLTHSYIPSFHISSIWRRPVTWGFHAQISLHRDQRLGLCVGSQVLTVKLAINSSRWNGTSMARWNMDGSLDCTARTPEMDEKKVLAVWGNYIPLDRLGESGKDTSAWAVEWHFNIHSLGPNLFGHGSRTLLRFDPWKRWF